MNDMNDRNNRCGADARSEAERVYGVRYGGVPPTGEPGRAPRMKPWQKGALLYGILALVLIGVCVLVSRAFTGGGNVYRFEPPTGPYIASMTVEGTIAASPSVDILGNLTGYYHQWTLERMDDLMNDANNRGIIIFVDSPGGGVYESDELYLKIREYKDFTGRPVYIAMGSMAASGGYYISAPADCIFANRNTWTGSIGVTLGTFIDISEFLENYGVNTHTITSGANKAMGSYFDPMTAEQQAIFQGLVDEAYEQFTDIVATERGLDITHVRTVADGRIYTAKQALELGLIDEIGSYDDALNHMRDEHALWDCELVDVTYVNDTFLGKFLNIGLAEQITELARIARYGRGEVGALLDLAEESHAMPISYLWSR